MNEYVTSKKFVRLSANPELILSVINRREIEVNSVDKKKYFIPFLFPLKMLYFCDDDKLNKCVDVRLYTFI